MFTMFIEFPSLACAELPACRTLIDQFDDERMSGFTSTLIEARSVGAPAGENLSK